MGSPRAEEVGEVMWPSPPHFFVSLTSCFTNPSQPVVCYHFASLLICAVNHRFDVTTAFAIVTYSRIHQTT
jgi:hypothetical protein